MTDLSTAYVQIETLFTVPDVELATDWSQGTSDFDPWLKGEYGLSTG